MKRTIWGNIFLRYYSQSSLLFWVNGFVVPFGLWVWCDMATPGNTPTAKVGTLGLGAAVVAAPAKSQRGQNKPKCKQCGNVARSRYLSSHSFNSFISIQTLCNPNPIHLIVSSQFAMLQVSLWVLQELLCEKSKSMPNSRFVCFF